MAKSRTARDGNRIPKRKNFKPKHLKRNGLVLVRDHTSKAFEPKAIDHHIIDLCGKNQVLVKDNYRNKKKVHVKDVKPIEMDIATAEFFRKEREQCTTRDAKHVMPIKLIPDLEWKFIENIGVMESDKGVTIYCIKENQDTKVSEPKTDVKTTENIKSVVTETGEAPGVTQITGNAGISQAILADPTEDTEVSEETTAEEIGMTDTIDVTEVVTGTPEPTLEATSKGSEESTTTPPGSPQRKNPEVQIISRDNTEVNAGQAVKRIHRYPKTNNSIVNKIFSVFRQAKESLDTIPM